MRENNPTFSAIPKPKIEAALPSPVLLSFLFRKFDQNVGEGTG
jgi:hypothetical protein